MSWGWKITLIVLAIIVLSMHGAQEEAKNTMFHLTAQLSNVQSQLDSQKRELSDVQSKLREMLERLRR